MGKPLYLAATSHIPATAALGPMQEVTGVCVLCALLLGGHSSKRGKLAGAEGRAMQGSGGSTLPAAFGMESPFHVWEPQGLTQPCRLSVQSSVNNSPFSVLLV